ncbi:MAG: TSUP family transporter [Pigmentiphaga sp.]
MFSLPVIYTHLGFMAIVAISVYAQNVTGFALALVLLGLVGLLDLVPLPDAANAVTVLGIVNAAVFLYRRRPLNIEPAIKPAIVTGLLGTVVGMAVLSFLAANAYGILKILLGVCIVVCALLLWRTAAPYPKTSGPRLFAVVGGLSGLMGGVFGAPGPPLVYAAYRQPWSMAVVQESLILSFGALGVLRATVMIALGQFNMQALILTLEAIPVVLIVTFFAANSPPPLPKEKMKTLVCGLLVCAGVGMLF